MSTKFILISDLNAIIRLQLKIFTGSVFVTALEMLTLSYKCIMSNEEMM